MRPAASWVNTFSRDWAHFENEDCFSNALAAPSWECETLAVNWFVQSSFSDCTRRGLSQHYAGETGRILKMKIAQTSMPKCIQVQLDF